MMWVFGFLTGAATFACLHAIRRHLDREETAAYPRVRPRTTSPRRIYTPRTHPQPGQTVRLILEPAD